VPVDTPARDGSDCTVDARETASQSPSFLRPEFALDSLARLGSTGATGPLSFLNLDSGSFVSKSTSFEKSMSVAFLHSKIMLRGNQQIE